MTVAETARFSMVAGGAARARGAMRRRVVSFMVVREGRIGWETMHRDDAGNSL